ncbi:hypothetical protein LIER_31172 [Lithospermum erythrorhizon]|uniref:Uncharacterized protein n=1 Tax=Lithospermum erythrorhizon TaxID=34254 RepID=A0AAV3RS47_LITER
MEELTNKNMLRQIKISVLIHFLETYTRIPIMKAHRLQIMSIGTDLKVIIRGRVVIYKTHGCMGVTGLMHGIMGFRGRS